MMIKTVEGGGVCTPRGFLAGAIAAGIRYKERKDLALIFSVTECTTAGMFTQNHCKSPTITLNRERLGLGRAVIINSGNANASTGSRGMSDARETAASVAGVLDVSEETVYVASTGVIGEFLPMDKIKKVIPGLAEGLNENGSDDVAEAILTTDTRSKKVAVEIELGGRKVRIGAIAKGSGMIAPNMATMLAFITTDADIAQELLQGVLAEAVGKTFNMITVDGDTSTNDMVLVFANGSSGNPVIEKNSADLEIFSNALEKVCKYLAIEIVKDGEGMTKFVTIMVKNAQSFSDARDIAFSVANSLLVKTALFAEDANWGRIMAAVGNVKAYLDPEKIDILFDDEVMVKNGTGLGPEAEKRVAQVLKKKEFSLTIDVNSGSRCATVWTTDLSYEYVRINADYRS